VASDYFGRQISNFRLDELAQDTDQTLRLLHLGTPSLLRKTQRHQERSLGFSNCFSAADGVLVSEKNPKRFWSRTPKPTMRW